MMHIRLDKHLSKMPKFSEHYVKALKEYLACLKSCIVHYYSWQFHMAILSMTELDFLFGSLTLLNISIGGL